MLTPQTFRGHIEFVVSHFKSPHNKVNFDTLCALWEPAIATGVGRAYFNPTGFLLGLFIIDPISGERQAVQTLWMQSPGHRSDNAALKLFREFEQDAVAWKADRILSGAVYISDMPRMRRLYKRLGYSPFSENFYKEIK